jgi:hypothetical protein
MRISLPNRAALLRAVLLVPATVLPATTQAASAATCGSTNLTLNGIAAFIGSAVARGLKPPAGCPRDHVHLDRFVAAQDPGSS